VDLLPEGLRGALGRHDVQASRGPQSVTDGPALTAHIPAVVYDRALRCLILQANTAGLIWFNRGRWCRSASCSGWALTRPTLASFTNSAGNQLVAEIGHRTLRVVAA
jgi:hypothetical protein